MGKFPELFGDHGRPNPGFSEANHDSSEERKIHPITGFYYFKIRKITKLIHTKKTTHPNVATWRGLARR